MITSPNFKTVNILIIQILTHVMITMELEVDSAVRFVYLDSYHRKKTLICKRGGSNAHDRYAVGCYKPDSNATLVGHVPKKIRFMCNLFLRDATNRITCVISGSRRYSSDLIQGGMKIPCTLIFSGKDK